MMQRLPRTPKYDSATAIWVDEAIWGHRLYDEQTPWFCMLEFLNVLASELDQCRAFKESELNGLKYQPYSRLHLRNILFNNPHMVTIPKTISDDQTRWSTWLLEMEKSCSGVESTDFSYLKKRFGSFREFAAVVEFLKDTAVEGENNKRWTSQFVFPYGPACLYEDLKIEGKNGSGTNDRRFFARTGEILYLMLSRSGKGEELLTNLIPLVFDKENKWNRLVSALQPDIVEPFKNRAGAYLPYEYLDEYNVLATDWLNLFSCKMPNYDVLPHLVNITGLNLIIYFLKRSREVIQSNSDGAMFVLEIMSPNKTAIREISSNLFHENNSLSKQAVEKFLRDVTSHPRWNEVGDSDDAVFAAANYLEEQFGWEPDDKALSLCKSPDELLNELVDKALVRHQQHISKFHSTWGKEIGLSSSRGSRRIRYAPTDSFLKTLVLCLVQRRMDYQSFLQKLYDRYGIVIGEHQAKRYIDQGLADREAFTENAKRLENRLASMGLLKRLSDACAYVENPYARSDIK